jgi:hypothetical protein
MTKRLIGLELSAEAGRMKDLTLFVVLLEDELAGIAVTRRIRLFSKVMRVTSFWEILASTVSPSRASRTCRAIEGLLNASSSGKRTRLSLERVVGIGFTESLEKDATA